MPLHPRPSPSQGQRTNITIHIQTSDPLLTLRLLIDDYLNTIKWTVAYTFDPTPGIGWTVVRPDNPAAVDTQAAQGKGYLVFVTADGTLTP